MNESDQQNSHFEEDEQVQIDHLDAEGSPQRVRAELLLALFRRGATLSWVKYSLIGLCLIVLLSAAFLHMYQPPSTMSPPPLVVARQDNLWFGFSAHRFYVQASDETVTAYEDETGHVLWRHKVPGVAVLQVFSQVLYCYYGTAQHQGRVEALNANNGHLLWQDTLPAPPGLQTTITSGMQGEQVTQENIQGFLQFDGDTLYTDSGQGAITAFQASTGQVRWMYRYRQDPRQHGGLMSVQYGVVEVQTSDSIISLLNASDGRERFHVQLASASSFTQIDGDVLYLLPSAGSSVAQNIQVFRLADGKQLWSRPYPSDGVGQVLEQNERIYVTTSSSLTVLNGSDGHLLWMYQAAAGQTILDPPLAERQMGSLAAANGLLYLLESDGQTTNTLLGLRLSDGQMTWRTRLTAFGDQANSVVPVFDNETIFLYVGSNVPLGEAHTQQQVLYGLNASNGHILWHSALAPGSLFFQGGVCYLLQANGQITAWRQSDARTLWRHQAPSSWGWLWLWCPPVDPAILIAQAGYGDLQSYEFVNSRDGKLLWRSPAL